MVAPPWTLTSTTRKSTACDSAPNENFLSHVSPARVDCDVDARSSADKASAAERDAAHEAEWLAQLRLGDPKAFQAIYERYRVRIYSFLLRLSGRRDLADDLLQDTFVQLARHAARLPEETRLAPWLYTVARNRYLSQRRTALFRLDRLRSWFGGDQSDTDERFPSPHHQASQRQAVTQLEQALQALSSPLREVILLVCIDELEQDQAARILGIQPAALRKRLERGRARLQELLAKQERGTDHGPVD